MRIEASNPEEYISKLPEDRQVVLSKMREVILHHLPEGFEEGMSYGFIGYVVPLSIYPEGYHCKSEEPLPFMSIASQKNFVALYHMGLYADPSLMDWWTKEYGKRVSTKLDMGKSCIRFKKMDQIPYDLIGELVAKMGCQEWIDIYEDQFRKPRKK